MSSPITDPSADSGSRKLGLISLATALGAILWLTPFAVLVAFVARYGVNLPFSDQWDFVTLIQKSRTSGVTLGDLFAQHAEQRMLFPRLIMLVLAPITRWNIRAELFVNLVLALGIAVALLLLLRRTLAPLGRWAIVPAIALSILVFSIVQWEDWFWGWQISWFLPLLAFVTAVAVLALWAESRPAWPALVLAIVAALVGQYSLFSGTLIWVMCVPIMLVRKAFRRHVWIWLGVGLASTLLYLYRYTSPPSMASFRAPIPEIIRDPKRPLAYILYYLGRPVLDADPSYWVGALFILVFGATCAYLVVFRRDRVQHAVVWFAIGSYALASSIVTMLNRLGLGLQFAGSSRYTTIGILLMISTLGLLSVALLPDPGAENWRARAAVVILPWVVVAAMFLADARSEIDTMRLWYAQKLDIRRCLERATSPQDPCLLAAYPAPDRVLEWARYLDTIGWAGFGEGRPPS